MSVSLSSFNILSVFVAAAGFADTFLLTWRWLSLANRLSVSVGVRELVATASLTSLSSSLASKVSRLGAVLGF